VSEQLCSHIGAVNRDSNDQEIYCPLNGLTKNGCVPL
jgi:hypothetical protein